MPRPSGRLSKRAGFMIRVTQLRTDIVRWDQESRSLWVIYFASLWYSKAVLIDGTGEYADSGRISGSGRCEAAPGNPAFGWCSFRASLFENNLAVSSMAVNVTVNSANWRHALSIAAL